VTGYQYDAAGRRVSKLDGKGQITRYVYDAAGRMTQTLYDDGASATFDYDLQGRRIYEHNQDSTRELSYDELGRPISVLDADSGRGIEYGYDAAGNRASMTVSPEGESTSFAYDGRGLITRMTDPESGEYRFSYDELGRRITTSYPNGMLLYTVYDAASRVLGLIYVDRSGRLSEQPHRG